MEAVLEITHAGCYTSRLTLDHAVAIRVLSGHRGPKGSVGLWEMTGPAEALAPAFADLKSHPHIVEARVVHESPGRWVLETVDKEAEVSEALVGAGLVFLPPVVISGGTETYRVFALDRSQIQDAVRRLTPRNRVRVLSMRDELGSLDPLAALTEKQRDALELAAKLGYYERPRRVEQEELARRLGMSRPTFSEHLARAERKVIEGLVKPGSE